MNNSVKKITFGMVFVLMFGIGYQILSTNGTNAYKNFKLPAVYEAAISSMPDKDLIAKINTYQKEFQQPNAFKKALEMDETAIYQTPLFKLAALKAFILELKNRQSHETKKLMDSQQIEKVEKFIKDQENKIKTSAAKE